MSAVLLDTHAWAWSLTDDPRLSDAARSAIQNADAVCVSPISFYEIGQKVRIGKWAEMAPIAADLPAILAEQGGQQAPLTGGICLEAAVMDWGHRDPFDRLLAATSRQTAMPLVSADTVFDRLGSGGGIARIW